jgi:hypothetical protein
MNAHERLTGAFPPATDSELPDTRAPPSVPARRSTKPARTSCAHVARHPPGSMRPGPNSSRMRPPRSAITCKGSFPVTHESRPDQRPRSLGCTISTRHTKQCASSYNAPVCLDGPNSPTLAHAQCPAQGSEFLPKLRHQPLYLYQQYTAAGGFGAQKEATGP